MVAKQFLLRKNKHHASISAFSFLVLLGNILGIFVKHSNFTSAKFNTRTMKARGSIQHGVYKFSKSFILVTFPRPRYASIKISRYLRYCDVLGDCRRAVYYYSIV